MTNADTQETAAQGPYCPKPTAASITTNPGTGTLQELVVAEPGASGFGPNSLAGHAGQPAAVTSPNTLAALSFGGLTPTTGVAGDGLDVADTDATVNPDDPITNVYQSNGSVSILNPVAAVSGSTLLQISNTPLQVEAVKTAAGTTTWGFDVTDWAGVSAECF